jgi:hypothetical protein
VALSFPHPGTGRIMSFQAPLPDPELWTPLGFSVSLYKTF